MKYADSGNLDAADHEIFLYPFNLKLKAWLFEQITKISE